MPTGWRPGAWRSTRIRRASFTLEEGFDFLGFNVRRYGNKPLIKPSKAAVRRIRERLRTELRSLRGTNAPTVIKKLNPIIRGWAAYYRTQVSAEIFGKLDHYLWGLTFKWARFSHANKSTRWVVDRYYGRFNKSRHDRWVFGGIPPILRSPEHLRRKRCWKDGLECRNRSRRTRSSSGVRRSS